MMRIGICDDMPVYLYQLRKQCEYFFNENCMEYEIQEFLSGEEVLEYKKDIDLLFLDIEMNNGIDGIETMEMLLRRKNVWKIVFVTNHDEKFKFTYGLKTLGYISKPVDYSSIEKWLNVAVIELKENKILMLKENGTIFRVNTSSIIYMRSNKNNTLFFNKNEIKCAAGNMRYWEEKIRNTSLIRIHKSYIVNMDYIVNRKNEYVMLQDCEEELPVGRIYRALFKESYISYMDTKINNRI